MTTTLSSCLLKANKRALIKSNLFPRFHKCAFIKGVLCSLLLVHMLSYALGSGGLFFTGWHNVLESLIRLERRHRLLNPPTHNLPPFYLIG